MNQQRKKFLIFYKIFKIFKKKIFDKGRQKKKFILNFIYANILDFFLHFSLFLITFFLSPFSYLIFILEFSRYLNKIGIKVD